MASDNVVPFDECWDDPLGTQRKRHLTEVCRKVHRRGLGPVNITVIAFRASKQSYEFCEEVCRQDISFGIQGMQRQELH